MGRTPTTPVLGQHWSSECFERKFLVPFPNPSFYDGLTMLYSVVSDRHDFPERELAGTDVYFQLYTRETFFSDLSREGKNDEVMAPWRDAKKHTSAFALS
jgi:hypothetical protein